jgi:(S)-2-hydroxy-acid oxidase
MSVGLLNLFDYEKRAQELLPVALYEYIRSGTADEVTLAENRAAFGRWFLCPRVLRPVGRCSTRTTLFRDTILSMPVYVSPTGVHALVTPEGECTTAAAARRAGILFGLSQHATRSMEHVAAAAHGGAPQWYQSYMLRDRVLTARLVQRAVHAGYQGIIVTVDSVRFGFREADARNGFNALPPPHRLVHYDPETAAADRSSSSSSLESTYNGKKHDAWDQNSELLFDPNCTWDDIGWLKQQIQLFANEKGFRRPVPPLIVKGIMTAADATLAVQAGADAIIVSNHGGRQLDTCLAPIDVLPLVVAAVHRHNVPVFMDGGIRRGTDVVKALALGAAAVGLGRPIFYALAVGGEQGVVDMLATLQQEIESAMVLCGCATVSDLAQSHVTRHPMYQSSFAKL